MRVCARAVGVGVPCEWASAYDLASLAGSAPDLSLRSLDRVGCSIFRVLFNFIWESDLFGGSPFSHLHLQRWYAGVWSAVAGCGWAPLGPTTARVSVWSRLLPVPRIQL
jgi:hypothetical protein